MTIPTEKNIRILLVDEQVLVRTGLRLLLESRPGFEVVGEVANFTETSAIPHAPPDIILLDLKSFRHQARLETLPELLKSAGKARILLLTDEHDAEGNLKAVRFGVKGVVHKNESAEVLLKAIERVYAGEVWINRALIARVIDGFYAKAQSSPPARETVKHALLTEREREVVTLISEGLRNKQMAERLFISEITVRHHLTSIFNKLGVADRLELAVYSYRHGLAKPPL